MSVRENTRRHWREWLVPGGLVALSVIPVAAGVARLTELARGPEITAANARFVAMPLPVVIHILAVIPYSLLGAFQFVPRIRERYRTYHRHAGRLLVIGALLTATSGLWMTLSYPWPAGDGVAVYLMRLVFGSAMLGATLAGIDAIRRRVFAAHGAWMTRAYAIGMGAGTQVLTHLPWLILVGKPDEPARAVLMGAGWVINIVVAEYVIRHGRGHGRVIATAVVA